MMAGHRPRISSTWPTPVEVVTQERQISNGLRLVASEGSSGFVEVRLVVSLERGAEVPSAALRAGIAECLGKAAAGRTEEDVRRVLGLGGATVTVEATRHHLVAKVGVLPSMLAQTLAVLSDLVIEPRFLMQDVRAAISRIVAEARHPSAETLQEACARLLLTPGWTLGDSVAEPWALDGFDAARLEQTYRRATGPSGSTLLVVGAPDATEALDAAEDSFTRWQGDAHQPLAMTRGLEAETVVIHRPGEVQASIGMVGALPAMTAREEAALAVGIRHLGGGSSSRLMVNLREDHGYAYYAYALWIHDAVSPSVRLRTEAANDVALPAIRELRRELEAATTAPLPQVDTTRMARSVAGRFAVDLHTTVSLADHLAEAIRCRRPEQSVGRLCRELPDLSSEEVLQACAASLAPASLGTIVIGDEDVLGPSLHELGPYRVVEMEPRLTDV